MTTVLGILNKQAVAIAVDIAVIVINQKDKQWQWLTSMKDSSYRQPTF